MPQITANDIQEFRTAARDYRITEELKQHFSSIRVERNPFYLNNNELDDVFRWKLDTQYNRVSHHIERNIEVVYKAVTEAVYKVNGTDFEYECEVRMGLLTSLPGVGVGGRVGGSCAHRARQILRNRL